jgi:hypothetical protein
VTPEEHIRMAEVYLARAEKGTTSGDGLAYIGEPGWERHINCYTRLATVHMQMASTKALLESTKQSATATEIRALTSEHKGTVTGRMHGTRLAEEYDMPSAEQIHGPRDPCDLD